MAKVIGGICANNGHPKVAYYAIDACPVCIVLKQLEIANDERDNAFAMAALISKKK